MRSIEITQDAHEATQDRPRCTRDAPRCTRDPGGLHLRTFELAPHAGLLAHLAIGGNRQVLTRIRQPPRELPAACTGAERFHGASQQACGVPSQSAGVQAVVSAVSRVSLVSHEGGHCFGPGLEASMWRF